MEWGGVSSGDAIRLIAEWGWSGQEWQSRCSDYRQSISDSLRLWAVRQDSCQPPVKACPHPASRDLLAASYVA